METTYTRLDGLELRADGDRHVLEGICVPYNTPTDRAGADLEQFAPGTFADLVAARARVKLTDYNHSMQRVPVGYSSLFEERAAGLWGRFRLNNTPEGESARANASEGVYAGLSIGFYTRAEEMRDGVRTVTAAKLDHVSLVEEPAYLDAKILSVRGGDLAAWRAIAAPPTFVIDMHRRESQTVLMARLRP
jgi:HK97 family phage prohead protease